MIKFENISKSFDDKLALDNINLNIYDGEFFVIVGSSGSGKTTCLKMINRLIDPSEGQIFIDGKNIRDMDIRNLRLDIGYVLQQGALFPNMTVYENIDLIPEMKKISKDKRKEKIRVFLKKVGLDPDKYLQRYPDELSGGEAQRVGILRAIIANPKILLMDEPFSALDPIFKNQLQDLVKEIHDEIKITTVFVTHDMNEALKLGDRILILKEGKIVQIDEPRVIKDRPENDFVEKFFNKGEVNE